MEDKDNSFFFQAEDGIRDGRELEGYEQGVPDLRVAEEREVVVEPDEAKRNVLVELDVQEREDQRRHERDQGEGKESDDPRRQEEQAATGLVPGQSGHSWPSEGDH